MSFGPAGPGPPRNAAPERDTVSGPFSTLLFLPGSSQRRGPEEGPVSPQPIPFFLTRVLRWAGPTSGTSEPSESHSNFSPGPPVGRPDVWDR